MRSLALLVLVVAGCAPSPGPLAPDAAGFNACDPGSPGPAPSQDCGGGGTGGIPTCGHACNSNVECGGSQQRCAFCSFGACDESAPGLLACLLACGVEPRPVWCDLGGCGEILRAAGLD